MRDGPSSEVLAGAAGWQPSAASWLDDVLLAESVPIASGRLTASTSSQVPESLKFTVPEVDGGVSWVPDSPTHPLARFGQVVDLGIVVTSSVSGEVTTTRLGRFRITDWTHDPNAGIVEVSCVGVLGRVSEDRFVAPETPRSGGTLTSEFRRLMSPGIPVSIDPTLVDRACPRSFQWPEDRLSALYEIADAWPARISTDQWGQVRVLPPLAQSPNPVLSFTDGDGGTVVSAPRGDTRDGLFNIVAATSSATDAVAQDPARAVARLTSGPMAATDDGTGYGRVVRYWSSPLATTTSQLQAGALEILRASARPAVVRTVQCAPDPRVELDDAASVTFAGVTDWGWVVSYELPLTVADGEMRIDVGVAS